MNKRRTLFNLFVFALVLVLLLNTTQFPVSAEDYYDKIDPNLLDYMNTVDDEESIPISVFLPDVDVSGVETEVSKKLGYSISDLNNKDIERINAFISEKRKMNSALYSESNQRYARIIEEYCNIGYICRYANILDCNIKKCNILKLAKLSCVSRLSYNDYIISDCLTLSRNVIHADYIQDTHYEYGYTGDGVSIGMLEGLGEPDLQKAQFIGADITLDTSFIIDPTTQQPNITPHATRVASIICSQGTLNCGIGIAPDSSVYCTYLNYNDEINVADRIHSRIAWLLDKGVNIINVSCTLNTHNVYGDFDNYVDRITKENSVVFVVASGNDGTDGVNSPGLAYNAITVGNINDNNTLGISDDSLRPTSSYTNLLYLFHIPSKPDLCAYGTNIDVNGANDSGTSFSAPHVSGALALLIEQEWMLTYSPAVLKAIVTAGVHIGKHHYVPENRVVTTQNDNPESSYIQYGAGILNCLNNADIVDNCNYSFGYFGASSIGTTTIFLVANRIFRYAFVYRHPYDATDFQNIDIFLLDPSGNTVASSQTTTNNLEIIEYTPTVAGTYTIKIQHTGVTNYATYIGEAWIQH